jgi:DNA-directed RNA polymerase subunit H (RpoH/RPB5)
MVKQLHKRFSDEQVRAVLKKYSIKEIETKYVLQILGIKPSRFFELLEEYRKDPIAFSISYKRTSSKRISRETEKNIIKELSIEKGLIENKDMPLKYYNYSYIKDRLHSKYKQKVSLPTIIDRAKKNDFYIPKLKMKGHTREVLTNYVGELIQHDASHHKWSPYVDEKWYLITTLDDYSRMLLYADFVSVETSWEHILALESVLLRYGLPITYYVDSHSIFRFVQGRDSFWRKHYKVTDEATPQWKQILCELQVKVIHALSPQARGKIERPYGWLQDRIVRTCARENIRTIQQGKEILKREVNRYNNYQVHSTTEEVPVIRFRRALKEKRSLFRDFMVPPPYKSTKDIFCLRDQRMVNAYRKISFNNLELKVPGVPIGGTVELRIVPDRETGVGEIRFWYENNLVGTQKVKNDDLNLLHF